MQWLPLDRVNAWRDPVKITYRLPDAHSRQQIDQSWFTQTVCPTRGGEISPFCRVISFHRSMRINHGFKPRFDNSVLGGGGGEGRFTPMDSTGGDVLVQGEEEEEPGYNLIPGLDFFDIISAWINRLLSQVKLYRIYINGSDRFPFSFPPKWCFIRFQIYFYSFSSSFLLSSLEFFF